MPRKYLIDVAAKTATEVWNYDQNTISDICSGAYEDGANNYLVDYAIAGGLGSSDTMAELVGLSGGQKVFDYAFATNFCEKIFNAAPIHLEEFEATAPEDGRLGNISGRSRVGSGGNAMIGGFVVRGVDRKEIIIRGLGPTIAPYLTDAVVTNPKITLYDSAGQILANDDYGPNSLVTAKGLTPGSSSESVLATSLIPGNYTVILENSNVSSGIGLLEIYETNRDESHLIDLSARGQVVSSDQVLIGGCIVARVALTSSSGLSVPV